SSHENKNLLISGNCTAIKLKTGIAPAETNLNQKSQPSSPAFVEVIRLKMASRCISAYTKPTAVAMTASKTTSRICSAGCGSNGYTLMEQRISTYIPPAQITSERICKSTLCRKFTYTSATNSSAMARVMSSSGRLMRSSSEIAGNFSLLHTGSSKF